VDAVLAARRFANAAGLGLRELGAKMVSGALVVDEHMRTSVPQIYASAMSLQDRCGDTRRPPRVSSPPRM